MQMKKEKKEVKEEKEVKKNENNQERQTKSFVFGMVVLIVLIVLAYFLIQGNKKFEYAGLEFQKGNVGDLTLYFIKIPLNSITGEVVGYASSYVSEDPRKLTNIPINTQIMLKREVALAADSKFVEACEDSILAATRLSVYLKNTGINPVAATLDKKEAEELNRNYVNCSADSDYSIIAFETSEKDEIVKENNCYKVNVANCNVMNVTERLMIGVYAHSRGIVI